MRCHVYASPSRRVFFERHFAPTFPLTGLELVANLHDWPAEFADVVYGSPEFNQCMQWAMGVLLDLLTAEHEPFLVSDADVRFYGPVADDLLDCLGDRDIAFQDDGPGGAACKGFYVVRPTEVVRRFFADVLERMRTTMENDEESTNELLKEWGARLSWGLLPRRYWTHGQDGKIWEPGDPLDPPADLLVHHANWTHGISHKLALLEAVREIHAERARNAAGMNTSRWE